MLVHSRTPARRKPWQAAVTAFGAAALRDHRGAHQHLGEAYLVVGDLVLAQAQLEALKRICLVPCDEQRDLEQAIAIYRYRGRLSR